MNYRYKVIIVMAVVSVGAFVLLYDYFTPAWVRIERIDNKDDARIVRLTDDDVARYPILQQNVLQLDEWYLNRLPLGAVEKTSKTEAIEIANLLDIRDERPADRGNFIYNDKTYLITINYQYERPVYVE